MYMQKGSFRMRVPVLAIASVLVLSGCTGLFQDSYQKIKVVTPGVENADCILSTEKNKYRMLTPRRVEVERSYRPMMVTCGKVGYYDGSVVVKSKIVGSPVTSHIYNGATESSNGSPLASESSYEYPDIITVNLRARPAVAEEPAPLPYMLLRKPQEKPASVGKSKADKSMSKSLRK
jgi:hypothetical protein